MKKLRYGIISASSIVSRFISAVKETNHSEVLAIASLSNKADSIAQQFGISKVYHSYMDLYNDPEIDIVYIANINELHIDEIRNGLNHGKHVLCEKPMVLHPDEVTEVFNLAKEKNLFLMEAQKAPFLPVSQHIKKIIDEEQLGKLLKVSINNGYGGRHPEGHWMHQAHQGGVWIPSANYALEYLHVLLGDSPIEANALLSTYSKEKTIDEAIVSLRYPNDILAQVSITTRVLTGDLTHFYFEDGWVEVYQNWKARYFTVHPHEGDVQRYDYPVEHELVYEVEHVHDMISQNKITSDVITPEVTYDCVSLVYEIYLLSQED